MPTKNFSFTQMLSFFRADNWFFMLASKIVGNRVLVLIFSKIFST